MNQEVKRELNAGEMVNRPRYTINVFHCVPYLLWYWWLRVYLIPEMRWCNVNLTDWHFPFRDACLIFLACGGQFVLPSAKDVSVPLARMKDIYAKFLAQTHLVYCGISKIKLTSAGAVLHPVDWFVKQMYDRFFPRQCAMAMHTYKRTNPTLQLRLDHLEQYAEPRVQSVDKMALDEATLTVVREVMHDIEFKLLVGEISDMIDERSFSNVKIDFSSASGYPYNQGRKKKSDQFDAEEVAYHLLEDDIDFEHYMKGHVWYTTGRARMQARDADPKGRLIVYAGYSYLLMTMLLLQPWARFMNRRFDWCGVGFSWMHDGAARLAKYMRCRNGFAPEGFRYVSLDISGWDTKLHPQLMDCLRIFYRSLMLACGVKDSYRGRFMTMLDDMIEARILMPGGHLFQVFQGMKSGWGNTANDNTLLHEILFRAIMKQLGEIHHILYGDDNLMLVPDHISDNALKEAYQAFGLSIKTIHSSRCLEDVDFLSKRIIYRNGHYYPFREAIETHARLLMPEESDPRRRDKPDAVVAAERILGHLLDNPFCREVRQCCYQMLELLRERYGVDYVTISDRDLSRHPWRFFDADKIPKRFPTVPSMRFIEELYGVPIPNNLYSRWPGAPSFIPFVEGMRSTDDFLYESAAQYSNDVMARMLSIAGKSAKIITKRISPYKQPVRCYGLHAARLEFAIKYFDIKFNNVLDFGSHPGACAASFTKYCDEIVCVSKRPSFDKRGFCPYVTRGASLKLIEADANTFKPMRPFDLLHDDVDLIGARSVLEDIAIGHGMIKRAMANVKDVEAALFTLREIDMQTRDLLYSLYVEYGSIQYVKPLFSNPWKSEFMVYVKRCKTQRKRKSVFMQELNGFLNGLAPMMMEWSEFLVNILGEYKGVSNIPSNPVQTDAYEMEWVKPWA